MKTLPLILLLLPLLPSCAQTVLYRDGQKIAAFQGDMKNVVYVDGNTRWSADSVDHSTATKAQGEAAAGKISAIGIAAATSGIMTLVK